MTCRVVTSSTDPLSTKLETVADCRRLSPTVDDCRRLNSRRRRNETRRLLRVGVRDVNSSRADKTVFNILNMFIFQIFRRHGSSCQFTQKSRIASAV